MEELCLLDSTVLYAVKTHKLNCIISDKFVKAQFKSSFLPSP